MTRLPSLALALVLPLLLTVACRQQQAASSASPAPFTVQADTAGARAYARLCVSCHGERGQGGGAGGPIDSKGHAHQHSDVYLANLIAKGNGFPDLRTNMPGFGSQLSQQEIGEVLALIKGWWTPEQRAFQEGLNRR